MAKLTIHTEDQSPETVKLEVREYILGRGGDLPNPIRDLDVSRHHAKLSAQRDGWWLEDLNSANGTWLNGDILETPQRLRTGDEIKLGQTIGIVRPQLDGAPAPTHVQVRVVIGPLGPFPHGVRERQGLGEVGE